MIKFFLILNILTSIFFLPFMKGINKEFGVFMYETFKAYEPYVLLITNILILALVLIGSFNENKI